MLRYFRRPVVAVTAVAALILAAVALLVTLLVPIAEHITPRDKDRAASVNATRQVLLACVAGLIASTGLAFTARTFLLSKRSHLTDRFRLAVTQLSSDKRTERLGGIYSLEHLMRESAVEHATVVAVLAAFVREQATLSHEASIEQHQDSSSPQQKRHPATDVQAAMTVLGRRPERVEDFRVDLSRSDLRGVNLYQARLDQAIFAECNLEQAILIRASLIQADFTQADLRKAQLRGVQGDDSYFIGARMQEATVTESTLNGAAFAGANLEDAALFGSTLKGATFFRANLSRASFNHTLMHDAVLVDAVLNETDFRGAELRHQNGSLPTRGITEGNLTAMRVDDKTLLPSEIPSPDLSGKTADEVIRRVIGAPKTP